MSRSASASLGGRKHPAFLKPLTFGPLRKMSILSRKPFWDMKTSLAAARFSIRDSVMLTEETPGPVKLLPFMLT